MLFKGQQETYNPQIHTEELSLTQNGNKSFAVHSKVLSKFERYNKFTSFLFHTGRVDGGSRQGWIRKPQADREIHDNAYRVRFKSLNIKPALTTGGAVIGDWHDANNPNPDMTAVTTVTYANGATATTVKTNMLATIAIKHEPGNNIFGDKFNPQDSFVLDSGLGTLFWIQRVRRASTSDHYLLDCKVIGQPKDFNPSALAEDNVLMEGGNYYGEGSMRGYQRTNQDYWKIFYSFISRYSLSFTGNSLDQRKVVWSSPASAVSAMKGRDSMDSLWQFEQEWEADNYFGIALELACRFSATSMDPSTHEWFSNFGKNLLTPAGMNPEAGITPPKTSDGWIRQIKDTIDLSYDVNSELTLGFIDGIANVLGSNSPAGAQGNTFMVIGDQLANMKWQNAMRKALGWNPGGLGGAAPAGHTTQIVYNIAEQKEIKLGFKVTSYTYNDNEFIFILDELFSHPGLNNRNGGLVGNGNMYIINVTPFDGVSNFELFSRGNGRYFIKKYVDGLHSLAGDSGMKASTGFDGAFCHYLAELFPIVYVEDSCAVIRGIGKYNGGSLSSVPGINDFPKLI